MIFFRTVLSFLLDKGYRDLLITTAFVLVMGGYTGETYMNVQFKTLTFSFIP